MDKDIRIGKKSFLLIVSLMSLVTMGNYVSLVDHKSAGGIKLVDNDVEVGTIVFRMDDVNPSEIYGGTWRLISNDAGIGFGDGTQQTSLVEGDNEQLVPIPKHTHTGTMSSAGAHSHSISRPRGDENYNNGGGSAWWGYSNNITVTTSTSGTHSHGLNMNVAGEKEAKLNVQGAVIRINAWEKMTD